MSLDGHPKSKPASVNNPKNPASKKNRRPYLDDDARYAGSLESNITHDEIQERKNHAPLPSQRKSRGLEPS